MMARLKNFCPPSLQGGGERPSGVRSHLESEEATSQFTPPPFREGGWGVFSWPLRGDGGGFFGRGSGGERLISAANSPQALQPCPADEPVQDRLRLIVGGVRCGDPDRTHFVRDFREELVAHAPGGRFEVVAGRQRRDVGRFHATRNAERRTEVAHERLVRVGVGPAQPVVDVRNGERHSTRVQRAQERDAVRATGDGHDPRTPPGRREPPHFPQYPCHINSPGPLEWCCYPVAPGGSAKVRLRCELSEAMRAIRTARYTERTRL